MKSLALRRWVRLLDNPKRVIRSAFMQKMMIFEIQEIELFCFRQNIISILCGHPSAPRSTAAALGKCFGKFSQIGSEPEGHNPRYIIAIGSLGYPQHSGKELRQVPRKRELPAPVRASAARFSGTASSSGAPLRWKQVLYRDETSVAAVMKSGTCIDSSRSGSPSNASIASCRAASQHGAVRSRNFACSSGVDSCRRRGSPIG